MTSSHTLRNCRGFTLIEVLVGVALLAVVMLLIYTTTSQSIRGKERIDRRRETTHSVRVTLAKISQDVSMAFLLTGPTQTGSRGGSPILKTVFKGIDSGDRDTLHFASLGHLRLFRNAKESESCEVGYKVENNPDYRDLLQIERRESKTLDDNPDEGGGWYPLFEKVAGLNFEYYDAQRKEWTQDWDSEGDMQKGKLPRAVRIKVTVPDPDKKDETLEFQTVSLLGMYANAVNF